MYFIKVKHSLNFFCIKFSMRNTIQYYYGIEVDNLTYHNYKYYFDDYIFLEIYKDLDIDLYNYLNSIHLNNYEIIMNKDNNYQTIIDKKTYVLLKKNKFYRLLNFNNLEQNTVLIKNKQLIEWDKMWEEKVDYYEKHIKTLNSNKVKQSFHYYIGLTENAISMYKMFKQTENVYLSHNRLSTKEDYLNPTNYIIDYRVRDVAEYVKKLVFDKKLVLNDLFYYLYNNQYTEYEYILLYIRLLYPSYYFDAYEAIVKGEEDFILDKYISEINNYEMFLNEIYLYLKRIVNIPKIEWLNKKDSSSDKSRIHPYL